jgi:hypothetical protein
MKSRLCAAPSAPKYGSGAISFFKGYITGCGTNVQLYETMKNMVSGLSFIICNMQTLSNNTTPTLMDSTPCYNDQPNEFPQTITVPAGTTYNFSVPIHAAVDIQSSTTQSGTPIVAMITPSELVDTSTDQNITLVPQIQPFIPPNSAFPVETDGKMVFSVTLQSATGGTVPAGVNLSFVIYCVSTSGAPTSFVMATFGLTVTAGKQTWGSTYQNFTSQAGFYAVGLTLANTSGSSCSVMITEMNLTYQSSANISLNTAQVCTPWGYWQSIPSSCVNLASLITQENAVSVDIRVNDTTAPTYRGGTMSIVQLTGGFPDYNGLTGPQSAYNFEKNLILRDSQGVYASSSAFFNPKNAAFANYGTRTFSQGCYTAVFLKPRPTSLTGVTSVPLELESTMIIEALLTGNGNTQLNPSTAYQSQAVLDFLKNNVIFGEVMSENPAHLQLIRSMVTRAFRAAPTLLNGIASSMEAESRGRRRVEQASNIIQTFNSMFN